MPSDVTAERTKMVAPSLRELAKKQNQMSRGSGSELIASNRVEGTKVFRPNGDRVGKIDHFMVDKITGQVEYAVMSFGGFLGLGHELRPLPWGALEYSQDLGGYVVFADDDKFRNSPFIEGGSVPEWDSAYARTLYGYWGVPY